MTSLAVWKLTSCDGCQLALLNLKELIDIAQVVDVAHFSEATSKHSAGPYDISLVEGSITTPGQLGRVAEIREQSRFVVAIGACATSGGIQALRNLADVEEFTRYVYAREDYIETLATSTPISDHIEVDLELPGCPVSSSRLREVIGALLAGRKPQIPGYAVCAECKLRGVSCVMVALRMPCLGPVTRAGCGAICPAFGRGCYGCFGPAETANIDSLAAIWGAIGAPPSALSRALATFNNNATAFREGARRAQD